MAFKPDTAELLGVSVYLTGAPITATIEGEDGAYLAVDAGRTHIVFHGSRKKLDEFRWAVWGAASTEATQQQAEEDEAFGSLDRAHPVDSVDLG
jgi:hypothetical protein